MALTFIRAVMTVATALCSYSLLRDALGRGSPFRWYDRTIRFSGAVLMLGMTLGGVLLVFGIWK